MNKNFSSDKPVSNEVDDKFQRYNFAKRIADTIITRKNNECIVIGIYGAWGEGKTSVINFIKKEIDEHGTEIIHFTFNPWRFTDEAALLTSFFNSMAGEIKKSFKDVESGAGKSKKRSKISEWWNDKKGSLKTPTETVGEIIEEYGKVVSIFGAGETAEAIGKAISKVDIEKLKERVEKLLTDNKKQVVIFIDDIDRLEKSEIHAIFRLVKLTGDFANTTYILSFDENMVSSAIGERFGEGNQKAGQNFLEKIVQVPLKIPVAQVDALKQFCFDQIDKFLEGNDIKLTDDEAKRFVNEFTSNVLPQLDTPRLAVRYTNSLAFSLPMLVGEVNPVDLMLIEAIKIFYPNHYEFVRNNPDYFIGSYTSFSGLIDVRKDRKIEEIKGYIELLGETLTKKQKVLIQNLLQELFPRLNEPFNNQVHDDKSYAEWFKNKRIGSSEYFNRYFTYAVIKGDVSDIAFQDFVLKIPTQEISDTVASMKVLVGQSSPDKFLQKIRVIEDEFDWKTSIKLAKAVACSSEIFPKSEGSYSIFGYDAPKSQAAILIYKLIKQHSNKDEQFNFAKELMLEAEPFEFAYELNNWLRSGNEWDKLFATEQYIELAMIMKDRGLKEAGESPLFEKFRDFNIVKFLLGSWAEHNKPDFEKYIGEIFDNNPSNALNLLNSFTPIGYGGFKGGAFKSDFSKEIYNYLTSLIDKDVINETLKKVYDEDEIDKEKLVWVDMGQNDQSNINIVRQFRHWYQNDISTQGQVDGK